MKAGLNQYGENKSVVCPARRKGRGPLCLSVAGGALWLIFAAVSLWGGLDQKSDGELIIQTPRVVRISLNEGLSQGTVNSILQDSQGYIWLGTQDGLNRLNGYDIKVYAFDPENPDTLPNNAINDLYESPREKGVIWMMTDIGVCRYSARLEIMLSRRNGNGLSDVVDRAELQCIREDEEGYLWMGGPGLGLFRWDRHKKEMRLFKNIPGAPPLLASDTVHIMEFDRRGFLWLGTPVGGLTRFDPKTGRSRIFRPFSGGLEGNRIDDILCDRDGVVWIAARSSHVVKAEGDKLSWDHPEPFHKITFPGISGKVPQAEALFEDRDGRLWFAGEAIGIYCLDKVSGSWNRYIVNPDNLPGSAAMSVTRLYQDNSGSLWIGAFSMGVIRLDIISRNFRSFQPYHGEMHGLRHKEIWAISPARRGGYWIGTDGGLYHFDLTAGRFVLFPHNFQFPGNPEHTRVNSVLDEDCKGGDLWIGADGGGLYRYSAERQRFFHYPPNPADANGLPHGTITCMTRDREGGLWMGTLYGGVSCIFPEHRADMRFTNFNRDTAREFFQGNQIQVVYTEPDGAVWVGITGGGILRYDRVSGGFHVIRNEPGKPPVLSDNRVLSILRDTRGFLWVGTSCGLNCLNPANGRWKHYYISDGLPNNMIYGILEDNTRRKENTGYIWMSTNKGVARLDPVTDAIEIFDFHDGLQGNEFNTNAYMKDRGGLLFFGGMEGLSVIDPANVRKNSQVPPVIISDFLLYNKPVRVLPNGGSPLRESISISKNITLSYDQNSFSFVFAALNFINPERNRYACKLEGFDQDWNHLERRLPVSYTNMPPGEYLFRVKGSNNDNVWNLAGAQVRLVIKPPFWKRWWFKILIGILVLALVIIIFRVHTAGVRQIYEKIALEEELKLKADFTAMLVHDLRSPMTAIMSYSELLSETPEKLDIRRTGKILTRTSRNMLLLINNMLDISKFEAGKMELSISSHSMEIIVSQILENMQPLYERKDVRIIWKPDPGLSNEPLLIDGEKISEVITNLLSNAIKYTPAGCKATIRYLKAGENFREFSVTDQGPGVAQEKQGLLFEKYAQLRDGADYKGTGLGLAVSRMIIEAHGGTIGFRPGNGGVGSNFWFRLPFEVPAKNPAAL